MAAFHLFCVSDFKEQSMTAGLVFALSFGIGIVTGLRSMTGPAIVSWACYLGWIKLTGSYFRFAGATWAVVLFSLAAIGEFIVDLLPRTPPRTQPGPLIVRIVFGFMTGECVGIAGGASPGLGGFFGALGAAAGTFAGYYARAGLVRAFRIPDIAVALCEDVLAVGLALLVVSRFS
jgi:uncharacterized membrane protein